ncbi:beta-ketoacyl synthase N-terminal-like domain-containing protein [Sulfurimonas sp.]|uniref:beta-ketoacyl synthase N-terminal-like domain-containing protein n=1 Tax=Sulfurimonas sp. TaxID=2022749 RepID=UPI002AB00B1B|nr:beta-ketoacyl synthase N-terminal-like domain-containing protein [Sulfurimonas sp.]
MSKIKILKYEINSAQGNISQTIKAIKTNNIKLFHKRASTIDGYIDVPYYLLSKEIKEEKNAILKGLRDVVAKTVVDLDDKQRSSTIIILGTSLADLNIVNNIQDSLSSQDKIYKSVKSSIDSYAKKLATEFGLNDFTVTISSACTSSANAILEARNFLLNDICEYVVVLGAEIFSKITNDGFNSMRILSAQKQRPFDVNRDGLILGEGIGAVLLSKNGKSFWTLEGGFSNCNAVNITSVSEDGLEYVDVMNASLKNSKIKAQDITALKAHATGTYTNDLSEINAISKVFDKDVVFTALKPYVGHTLGSSGVLELCIFIDAIENGFIPKTLNHSKSILKDYVPLLEHKECYEGVFMLNYFGFGGNNTSLIIKKEKI